MHHASWMMSDITLTDGVICGFCSSSSSFQDVISLDGSLRHISGDSFFDASGNHNQVLNNIGKFMIHACWLTQSFITDTFFSICSYTDTFARHASTASIGERVWPEGHLCANHGRALPAIWVLQTLSGERSTATSNRWRMKGCIWLSAIRYASLHGCNEQ